LLPLAKGWPGFSAPMSHARRSSRDSPGGTLMMFHKPSSRPMTLGSGRGSVPFGRQKRTGTSQCPPRSGRPPRTRCRGRGRCRPRARPGGRMPDASARGAASHPRASRAPPRRPDWRHSSRCSRSGGVSATARSRRGAHGVEVRPRKLVRHVASSIRKSGRSRKLFGLEIRNCAEADSFVCQRMLAL
jgi:hypothetical protein